MKKQRALLTMLMTLLSLCAVAQGLSVGVAGGYTHNTQRVDNSYAYGLHFKGRGGFTVSVPVQYDFKEWFAVRADVNYMQKNHRIESSTMVSNLAYTEHYLQVPLMAHFSFGGERLRGYINAGGYLGSWLSSHMKGYTYNAYEETQNFDQKREFTPDDRRIDCGLLAGAGVEYKLSPTYTLFGEATYYYSTTSRERIDIGSHTRYDNTLAIQAGVRCYVKNLLGK